MENNVRSLIREFNKSKNIEIFESLTHELNLHKCIVTGEHIIYKNTKLRLTKENKIKIDGTSAYTKKIVNGNEYLLRVSYDGMISEFGSEYSTLNASKVFNMLNKFTKFAFQINDYDYEEHKKTSFGSGVSLEVMIARYGEEEGSIKFDEYRQKQAYTNSFEYKNKKYGWDADKFKAFNKSRSITLENLIKKYGKNEGILKYERYCDKQSKTSTIEYLINKFGQEKAQHILDARGKRIRYFEKTYGDKAIEKYIEYWENVKNPYYSKISIELFDLLIYELQLQKYSIYYRENEFGIYDKASQQYFKYDFTIPELKLIIEFNGDSWHGNPSIFSKDDNPHPINKSIKASDLWEYDNVKRKAAETAGFEVLYVWEDEYVNNFEKTYITIKQKIDEIRIRRH